MSMSRRASIARHGRIARARELKNSRTRDPLPRRRRPRGPAGRIAAAISLVVSLALAIVGAIRYIAHGPLGPAAVPRFCLGTAVEK
jgi:hypothetical protein